MILIVYGSCVPTVPMSTCIIQLIMDIGHTGESVALVWQPARTVYLTVSRVDVFYFILFFSIHTFFYKDYLLCYVNYCRLSETLSKSDGDKARPGQHTQSHTTRRGFVSDSVLSLIIFIIVWCCVCKFS